MKDGGVALEQERPDPKEFDLFDVVIPRDHRLEVHPNAGFGRTPTKQTKRLTGETRLGQKGGNGG